VMIIDPHPAVSRMLARMVARLGYEPIAIDVQPIGARPTPAQLRGADALLIEPASPAALALARTARAANPALAIIGEGAVVSPQQARAWDRTAAPTGHLAKPFTIEQLDAALQQGFAHRDGMGVRPVPTVPRY
jgi:hypothetical protein